MAPQAGIVDSGRSPPRLARPGGHAAAAAAANSLVVNRVETNRHNGLHSLPKGSARILGRAEFFYIIFAILRKYTTVQEEYSRRGPRRSATVNQCVVWCLAVVVAGGGAACRGHAIAVVVFLIR